MTMWIIIGMAVVTAIPRMLPAFIIDRVTFPDWVNRWLNAIPYAALGALIFPGIMTVKDNAPHVGIIGGLVAVALAWLGLDIILVVLGSILTVFLITL
ncbi:AzlD domain-containing protein [Thalassobacillus sp. CUG 92003]|uniref:AzlD domain-containing protein n=1 Tax=Thalassobacillus sp. CUG 92003 TaxID=2736641 RepID=UPI0015E65B73|nr:AzlD domain-containing protein [Thalassobacillus sp. CUG 92003]